MTLDMDFVRAQFPAFAEPSLQGQAFFENAGGSYTCRPVIDRLTRFYTQRKVQPYAPYEASRLAGEEMDEARTRMAAILGVEGDELSFGPSTTQNTYVLAQAFAEMMQPDDAIIVTNQDHEANSGPWRGWPSGASRSANGGSIRRPGIWTPKTLETCWTNPCGWSVFRIAPTWWARSIRWSRSRPWPMRRGPSFASMGSAMRRMAFPMWV